MSMSEFESNLHASDFSMQHQDLPDDFSEDDIEFAQELGVLFSPDQEEMPPSFVQTLLEPENPRFQPVEHGFELKTQAHVLAASSSVLANLK